MNVNLETLDRQVGLQPLPYWQNVIAHVMHRDKLCVAGHVRPRHVEALIRSRSGALGNLSQGELADAVAKAVGTANITQTAMLDLVADSWGLK